ncbi:MAG TPA: HD domain-containing protein [bacterium]|nr:HD domain-containing protein [bacterium]
MVSKIDPRSKSDIMRDPISGYIRFTIGEKTCETGEIDLIDNRWMQRLKRIFQLQTAWLVYPGAVHTRFLHSMGVMDLAGKFARKLYYHFKEIHPEELIPDIEYVVETCRIAGLLHDIGHGPFGHTLDQAHTYKKFKSTHEDIGRKIILTELSDIIKNIKRSPEGKFDGELDPALICNFIKPVEPYKNLWEKVFSKIIYGLYSVDKLDYLARDSYFCGVREYGLLDIDRLIETTSVFEDGLMLHKSSASALKAFLISRLFMYENVYYHKTVRSIDISFSDILGDCLDELGIANPMDDIESFYNIDDFYLHSIIPGWKNGADGRKKNLGEIWSRLLNRELYWKIAYQKDINALTIDNIFFKIPEKDKIMKMVTDSIKEPINIRVDTPILDVRPENPFSSKERKNAVAVYDPILKKVDKNGLAKLSKNIPVKFISFRIFSEKECADKVYLSSKQLFEESDFDLQESSF